MTLFFLLLLFVLGLILLRDLRADLKALNSRVQQLELTLARLQGALVRHTSEPQSIVETTLEATDRLRQITSPAI